MARRSQCSSAGDNPLDPNYLPPHYREEYRLAIDALVEEDLEGYYQFLQKVDVVDFLSTSEIQYIQESVQVPQHSSHPEQRFLETGGDGSSDTYWPIHSDLDAPGLDLGWPQLHHFIGPTEVTTLVNPPEPDMPSIKEQARRLIKNAQQVIAIVMDMFTDVDILHDILNAAMRNVAVYILLDEQNAHHFVNMVSNCRVNIQSIQFLRVRIVSGITYHCRSGKSFKGQMMDRFLLTDCRAVLSGNYSFMWSFEKLHRCMAHLFLGQLVSTFDEEFRILFAQSQPLIIENMFGPVEDFNLSQKRQYLSDRTLYRDPRKFQSLDMAHPEDLARHSYDERMDVDWRMMPLKRKESLHGPADIYSRFPSQQSRLDPPFDQGPSRMPMMENPAFKRHSYAEGVHGRYSFPFLPQQGMPEPENQGRQLYRRQQPFLGPGPGKEADYSDKFWSQDYHSGDQYSEPGLPQEMEPPDNFDPVLNYLSSTRNADFDQGSDKLPPAEDLPFSSSYPRRLSLGQSYACQTSPTSSNPTEQKQFFQEPNFNRKDPMVKRGLRDWRISSYLSAYDNKGDEGLPLAPPYLSEEPSEPIQQTIPGTDLSVPKILNVREFKIPAIPRASQMPSYSKTTAQEQPKKLPDDPSAVAVETKTTPTPSESSSTTEGEKTEEAEQKEPKTAFLHREESFRRKYSPAVPRSSRLRSSLIFSSLEQQQQQQHTSQDTKTTPSQKDEESNKSEAEQTKQPFVYQALGQRRSTAREPFEWSSYKKSATFDSSATESSKTDVGNSKEDDKDSSNNENPKDFSEKHEAQESLQQPDVEQTDSSPSMPQSKPSEAELPKIVQPVQPPKSLLTSPLYVDMSDPDKRLMFFKELAAKRKAAKTAEAKKSKEKILIKPPTELKTAVTMEETGSPEAAEKMADTAISEGISEKNATAEYRGKIPPTEASKSVSLSSETSAKTNKEDSQVKNDPSITQSCKEAAQTRVSTDSEMIELKNGQLAATLPVSAEPVEPKLSDPAVERSSPSHPPTPTNATPTNVPSLAQGTNEGENPCLDSTSNTSSLLPPSSVEAPQASAFIALDSKTQNPKPDLLETSISSPLLSEHIGSEFDSPNLSVQRASPDHILPDSGTQISPSPHSSPTTLSTPVETKSSDVTSEDSSSTPTSSILSLNAQGTAHPLAQSVEETSEKSTTSPIRQTESNSTQNDVDSVSELTTPEVPSALGSANVESDMSPATCSPGSEPESESENCSVPPVVGEDSEVPGSSKDVKADSTSPTVNPSSPESCLPNVADVESICRSDQNENVTPPLSPAVPLSEHSLAETNSPVPLDLTPNASQSEVTVSPQDAPIQVTPPSELNLTGPVTPSPAETVSCSPPLTESVASVLSPEAEKTLSVLHSLSDTNFLTEQDTTDANKTPVLPSTETCSPTEPTSKVPPEPDLICKTPESVTSETHLSESAVPADNSNTDSQSKVSQDQEPEMPDRGEKKTDHTEDTNKVNKTSTQELACSEKAKVQVKQNSWSDLPESRSDEVVAPSPQSKQPKSSQSRYQSSTANILSSSNLRDDTKLLLEQISANNQSRNEATKESPVTDDEKEDEADKNAKREKERNIKSLSRGQPKSTQEREKLLERIQSMRKERKVYSRFEMAP
uniref:protein FAM83H n=1 Tax=Scatophagus argus TaxID=75038 RepID=UPI001ED82EAB|nr:protein FAM83H [Scatophagus argus]XP_046258084.1 protein FAM83H [Scatophagus argus]